MHSKTLSRVRWIAWVLTSFWLVVVTDQLFPEAELIVDWSDWQGMLAATFLTMIGGLFALVLPAYLLVMVIRPWLTGKKNESDYDEMLMIEVTVALAAFATGALLLHSLLADGS